MFRSSTRCRCRRRTIAICFALSASTLAACGSSDDPAVPTANVRPSFLGTVTTASYDGTTDDLLTAGLGWEGLQSATLPPVSAQPTAAELRRRAIYRNYRALVDISTAGGYGVLYGPNVPVEGGTPNTTPGAGKIAGTEYLAYSVDASGRALATLMVQIPSTFSQSSPCIVTASSSGSRGVYGAVSAAGEWGLKRGCAVAYTDKGTGNGAHELDTNTITLINGLTANATSAGNTSHFTAPINDSQRTAFAATNPFRYAFKHAHSQANPEKDWGLFTRQAIEFALWAVNEQLAPALPGSSAKQRLFFASNTLVIASSVSNGGGASIQAVEGDTTGLIDALVVGEPVVYPTLPAGLTISRGGVNYASTSIGRPLYDYISLANLLQPCAAYAPALATAPGLANVSMASAQNRCGALATNGQVSGADFTSQSNDALAQLRAAGWEPESDVLHASLYAFATPAVAVTYANTYARASVVDNLCGFSLATTNATSVPAAAATSPMLTVFAEGNGVPPTNGINVIYNDAVGGPVNHLVADNNFAALGALCLRQLWTTSNANAVALQAGVSEVRLTGNLRGKPAIIVHGRADGLIPVNHTSRPYFGTNKVVEGTVSRLSYIEVLNAQHFETFIPAIAGYDTRFIPMHYYDNQALNLMWNHLRNGAALPPSQVVRPTPRGGTPGAAPAITTANLPPIQLTPATGDAINFSAGSNTVQIPN
ncbi:MAG: D-(-)-3-hydroxybutyrate oligomer hydrolase [Burkholderiaceae bacterium]|nr:D-(-)-3-hydroxybutyrate oligomer hydrolase [Burkholderiaceae bacterium]